MKKQYRAVLAGFAACILFHGAVRASAPVIEPERTCALTIRYRDTVDGDDPVAGAEFTYYRVAALSQEAEGNSVGVRLKVLIRTRNGKEPEINALTPPGSIEEDTLRTYKKGLPAGGVTGTIRTDANGTARAAGLLSGIYLIRETKSAKEHLPCAPFLAAMPRTGDAETGNGESGAAGRAGEGWQYETFAEPKPQPCGDLVISKIVKGTGGEYKKRFRFEVTIGAGGTFRYRRSDGASGAVMSGGIVRLRSGESVVIESIPAGTAYSVRELEADRKAYSTRAEGAAGRISRAVQSMAVFTNTKQAPSSPGGTPSNGAAEPSANKTQYRSANAADTHASAVKAAAVKTGDSSERPGLPAVTLIAAAAVILIVLKSGRMWHR